MFLKGSLKSKKYLSRIYLWITAAIFLIVTVFSLIVYVNVEQSVMKNENKTNRKILYQVKYNIDNMDDMIKNLCLSIYMNPDTVYMMFDTKTEYEDLTWKINRLRTSMVDINQFVHSIYIYNHSAKAYFTTSNGLYYQDPFLEQLIRSYGNSLPKMRPLVRTVKEYLPNSNGESYRNVITYLLFDTINNEGMPDGAIVVNIKSEWMFGGIEAINMIDQNRKESLFILDEKGNFIEDDRGNTSYKEALKNAYEAHLHTASGQPSDSIDSFVENIQGEKYLISYINIEKANWVLLKTQPFNEVYDYILKLKNSIIIITGIFLTLALLLAATITRNIYKPLGNLVKEIRSGNPSGMYGTAPRDEFSFLHAVYTNSIEQINRYSKEKGNTREIMKTYSLRKLIVDSHSVTAEDFEKLKSEYGISLQYEGPFAVCILKLDRYNELVRQYSSSDLDLFRFAIINITSEVVARSYVNEGIDMKNEQIVIVLNVDDPPGLFHENITALLKEAQEYIMQYYKVPVSATVSDITQGIGELTKHYNITLSNSMYAYVFGAMAMIKPADVAENSTNSHMSFSSTLERRLGEEIKAGNLESIEEVFKKITREIAGLNYKNMMLSVMHLVNIISDTVEEIARVRVEPVYIDYNMFQDILEMSTLDELYQRTMEIFRQIVDKTPSAENEKHMILVEAIKDIILANYQDSALCLQQIADMLKMSQVYVGKIFKGIVQMSVAEYINDIRLKKAAEWLEISNFSINEITVRVGMENESYFYKLFKKKFGVTPKEYALKKAVRQL